MRTLLLFAAGMLTATAAQAQRSERPFMPMHHGTEARYDGWRGDGAPRPPSMWRGQGGDRWMRHYKACRERYGAAYRYRTDMVMRHGHGRRCRL